MRRFRLTLESNATGAKHIVTVRAKNENSAYAAITNPLYRIVRVEMLIEG